MTSEVSWRSFIYWMLYMEWRAH